MFPDGFGLHVTGQNMIEASSIPLSALTELGGDGRFALLVNAIRDQVIYLLDREGNVASWNAGAQRFKAYTADEIIGQCFSRFYPALAPKRMLPRPQPVLRQIEHGYEACVRAA